MAIFLFFFCVWYHRLVCPKRKWCGARCRSANQFDTENRSSLLFPSLLYFQVFHSFPILGFSSFPQKFGFYPFCLCAYFSGHHLVLISKQAKQKTHFCQCIFSCQPSFSRSDYRFWKCHCGRTICLCAIYWLGVWDLCLLGIACQRRK